MSSIVYLDVIYIVFAFATTVLLLLGRKRINLHVTSLVPLVGLSLMQTTYGIITFLEWDGISTSFEKFEDLSGALIPMFWVLVLYVLIQYINNSDLRVNEERLQLAIKGTQAGLWDWSVQTGEFIVNDRWVEIIGYTQKELQPITIQTWLDHINPDDQENSRRLIEQHIAMQSDHYECDVRMRHKDGHWVWIHDRGGVVERDDEGRAIRMTGTHIDVTEKKQIELELEQHRINLEGLVQERTDELECAIEELKAINEDVYEKNLTINEQNQELQTALYNLKEAQTQLLQAEKMASLGILTAGVAHEINNPLNFIRGGCIGLENQLKSGRICDAERVEVLLESINTGVDRVSSIVKSLNQFSGAKDNNEQNCDIVAIIENCLIMLQSRLNDRIAIIKEYDQDKLILLGNSSDLHQAIIHILHNAVQSIADKGIIRVRVQRKHNHIVLEIRDSGCGIEGKHLAHVTDPFYTTKSPGEGVGLGLSLTYSIIRAHNGRIEFESEPNVGTTVRISLPITTVNNYV